MRLWTGMLVAALLVGGLGGAPAAAGEKNPAVAGVLGLVPGFGAGYWYTGNRSKGTIFAVTDTVLTVGMIAGWEEFGDHLFDSSADTWGTIASVCLLARVGSGIYQCVDGIADANRVNRAGGARLAAGPPAFGWGLETACLPGLANSDRYNACWTAGAEGRLRAAALGQARAALPTWQLTASLPDTGVGVSFNSRF